jgi:hypothetical protein
VALLAVWPLQIKNPVGGVAVGHISIEPVKGLIAAVAKAVVASCVVDVPVEAVGAVGVPVNTGFSRSAFVPTATAILLNSVSISVPLTIFKGLPAGRASFEANDVLFTYWVILVFHS